MRQFTRGLIYLLATAAICGCRRAPDTKEAPLPENAVARVGSEIITVSDFQEAMRRRPVGNNAKAREALLDELVEARALVQEARARGYDRDPKMIAAFERLLANKVRTDDQAAQAAQSKITPEEIDAYYRAHFSTFTVPAKIRVAMIFVEAPQNFTEEKRTERRAKIDEARSKAATEQSPGFGRVAAEYSYDQATKYKGGDLGYLLEGIKGDGPDTIEAPVLEAGFALKNPGQLSDIIVTPRGFYLLKLMERHDAAVRPINAVRNEIASKLQREKTMAARETYAKKITSNKKVELRPDRLAAIPAPPPDHPVAEDEPSAPPPVPNR